MLPAPNPIQCKLNIQEVLTNGPATVCIADADGLKGINDKYSHVVGDRYLECVLNDLQTSFPQLVWDRYGGDEFVGVASGEIDVDPKQTDQNVVEILTYTIRIGYSLGVVHTIPNDTVELAMAMADAAMYEAKHFHHGGVLLFKPLKTIGFTQGIWEEDWYIPLAKDKIRVILDYEHGDVDLVFSQNCEAQDGIYVKDPKELQNYISLTEPDSLTEQMTTDDEFGDWGVSDENLKWRSSTPKSKWDLAEVDTNISINIETGNKDDVTRAERPKTVVVEPTAEKINPKRTKRLTIPQLPSLSLSLPSLPSLLSFKGERPVSNGLSSQLTQPAFRGKVIWIWGNRAHEIDIKFAKYLANQNDVLFLDGDFASPQHAGSWSISWVSGSPARPPSNPMIDGRLTIWGLGKKPPKITNAKSLWDNVLYSLNTQERVLIVGAGKIAPPPHVDVILFVTEDNIQLSYPAIAVYPTEQVKDIVKKVENALEKN